MEEIAGSSLQGSTQNANDHLLVWRHWYGISGKWEIEGKITDGNRNNINRYFELFEEHIAPKLNALIAVVELKRLFPGFHEFGRLPQKSS